MNTLSKLHFYNYNCAECDRLAKFLLRLNSLTSLVCDLIFSNGQVFLKVMARFMLYKVLE